MLGTIVTIILSFVAGVVCDRAGFIKKYLRI